MDTLDPGEWFILRCASADTLKVARQLEKRGFDVWTPIERKYGRKPRTRAHFDKEFALMPSYLFAAVYDLPSLQTLADLPTSDTPRFTLFRYAGGVPLIADKELNELRSHESELQRKYELRVRSGKKGPKFDAGQIVRVKEGGFAGLDGIVQGQQGQFTLVSVNGFASTIKIASCLLGLDSVSAETGDAALAA